MASTRARSPHVYGRDEAHEVIRRSQADYRDPLRARTRGARREGLTGNDRRHRRRRLHRLQLRAPRARATPTRASSCSTSSPTPATSRACADVAGDPRFAFVHGDIADRDAVRAVFARAPARRAVVNFAAETPRRPLDRRPARLRADQRRRHLRAARGGAPSLADARRRARERFRFLHVSTDEVYGTLGADGRVLGDDALRAQLALRRLEGRRRPPGARLPRDLRAAGAAHQLLEQLRPVPVPREADPADDPERRSRASRCRSTATAATCATGSTSRTTARGILLALLKGAPGEKYNLGGGNERTNLQIVDALCAALEPSCPRPGTRRCARGLASYRASRPSSPTGPATTAATRSTPRRSARSSAGSRATPSRRACARRCAGTSRTTLVRGRAVGQVPARAARPDALSLKSQRQTSLLGALFVGGVPLLMGAAFLYFTSGMTFRCDSPRRAR